MKKLIALSLFLFAFQHSFSGNISIQIISPTNDAISDSVLNISANIQSVYELSVVTATVGGLQDTLLYNSADQDFEGSINVRSFPKGDTLTLTINANDIFNNQQSANVNFISPPPPPPGVNIIYPLNYSNAFPSLRIKAAVALTGNYSLQVVVYNSFYESTLFTQKFTDSVDTTITLPQTQGSGTVYFTVTDKWKQESIDSRQIIFDGNYLYKQVYIGNGSIYDFNYNEVLESGNPIIPRIVNVTTLAADTIKGNLAYIDNNNYSFLTPYGAIFYQNLNELTFDWNNDSLYQLGTNFRPPLYEGSFMSLHTAGKYATWVTNMTQPPFAPELYLRDLSTRTDKLFDTGDGVTDNAVAADGSVVDNNLDETYGSSMIHPLTDGKYTVYSALDPLSDSGYIYLNTGNTIIPLSVLNGSYSDMPPWDYPAAGTFYQLNNHYVAYIMPGTSGQNEIWFRDSTGNNKQLTFFGTATNTSLELLNQNGDVVYDYNDERYLVTNGSMQPRDIGFAQGKLYYRDSSWYVALGSGLFKLSVTTFTTVNNGDWNNPSTWQDNVVPPANADIVIKNWVTVTNNVSCNSLRVVLPGSITVDTGFNLSILHP